MQSYPLPVSSLPPPAYWPPCLHQAAAGDTAAGHCVVAEAGGRVLAAGGQRLRYNQTPSLLNPDFSVAAPPCFAWQDTLP